MSLQSLSSSVRSEGSTTVALMSCKSSASARAGECLTRSPLHTLERKSRGERKEEKKRGRVFE